MGKPTGFMEYEREDQITISPEERIKNFEEFHIGLPLEEWFPDVHFTIWFQKQMSWCMKEILIRRIID